jgi:nucleoid-associated protein YgaU
MSVRQLLCPAVVRRSKNPINVRGILEALALSAILGMFMFVAGNCARGVMVHAAAPKMMTITVQPGDTLWSLAKRYGDQDTYILARVDALAKANRLSRGGELFAGQTLLVPTTTQRFEGKTWREMASR